MHLLKRSIEGGVYICPAHVVLKHELPTGVFLEIKAAKKTQPKPVHKTTVRTRKQRATVSTREIHLLKTSNALLGADGMLHFGAADCVGHTPAVRTFTERFKPLRDILKKSSNLNTQWSERARWCHAVDGLPPWFGCGTRIPPLSF